MRPPSAAQVARQIEVWNAAYTEGTAVIVRRDDGSTHRTTTTSAAWNLCGVAVVKLADGVPAGGYMLNRVSPTSDAANRAVVDLEMEPLPKRARVKVNDRVVRLTSDGNKYADSSRVTRIEGDANDKGCDVTLVDDGTGHETVKRGVFHRDGSATLTQVRPWSEP